MIKILLVDDDPVEHKLFEAFTLQISDFSINLDHALTLEEAIQNLHEAKPDIIFLDSQLAPYTSFEETVPEFRSRGYRGPLFVITSARGSVNHPHSATGITAHIDKLELGANRLRNLISDTLKVAA